jgi:hypothetical protein
MLNFDPKNEKLQEVICKLDELITVVRNNLASAQTDEIELPVFNMFECELANPETFENHEWDFGNRSLYAMKSGYSGAELKAKNLKVNGTIGEGSHLYLKDNLFCGNCFGFVEAKNMVAESVGTLHNKKYFKDKSNFRIAETLVINGQSLFAYIDAWKAEFSGLVRNSAINIGHRAIFHELGNGANISVDPVHSYFFVWITDSIEDLKEKVKLLKKERDRLETEMNNMKYKYDKMARVEMDHIPDLTRERIKENRAMYEDIVQRFDEIDRFFMNNIFDTKLKELNSLLVELRKNAMANAKVIIKGTLKPVVNISFAGRSLYFGEETENIIIKWNGSEIVTEKFE